MEGAAAGAASWITEAVGAVTSVMGACLNVIQEQPILAMCFVGGVVIPLGIGLFRSLRSV